MIQPFEPKNRVGLGGEEKKFPRREVLFGRFFMVGLLDSFLAFG